MLSYLFVAAPSKMHRPIMCVDMTLKGNLTTTVLTVLIILISFEKKVILSKF